MLRSHQVRPAKTTWFSRSRMILLSGWFSGFVLCLWTNMSPAQDFMVAGPGGTAVIDGRQPAAPPPDSRTSMPVTGGDTTATAPATSVAPSAEESGTAGADEETRNLRKMRESQDAALAENIVKVVKSRIGTDSASQDALAETLLELLKTPDGYTVGGSGMSGMSSGIPPSGSGGPGIPPSGSGGPGMPSSGSAAPKSLAPIPVPVVYACVHGLFQLKSPAANKAIASLLAANETVEDERIVTGLLVWEMARRFSPSDMATLIKCIAKPTDFRKATTIPIAAIGIPGSSGSSPYPGSSSPSSSYPSSSSYPGGPGSQSTKKDPLSAQDLQQLATIVSLVSHPTKPIQMAVGTQMASPTCDPALRKQVLTILQMAPSQYMNLREVIGGGDQDPAVRALMATQLINMGIVGMPELMGLPPAMATYFDGKAPSGLSDSAGRSGNSPGSSYPGASSSYPGASYSSSPSSYSGGPGGSGPQVDVLAQMKNMQPGSQDYAVAILQQTFMGTLSQGTSGSARMNEFGTALAQIFELDPSLMIDAGRMFSGSALADTTATDSVAVFWSDDAIKKASASLTGTGTPEQRGTALVSLATVPTVTARQALWKYLRQNQANGPGDLLAVGIGEKVMPDPSLIIAVKSLANAAKRRQEVPLSSTIVFASPSSTTSGGMPGSAAPGYPPGGYPGGTPSGYPGGTPSMPGPAAPAASVFSGRTSWAAFSDYLRHWMSQRFTITGVSPEYTRVAPNQRPYDLPQEVEVLCEYRCVLPTMIPNDRKAELDGKVKIDPTYVYFVRFRSNSATSTRVSFTNSQLKKKSVEGAPAAQETFLGSGYWLDWFGVNPATGFPRSVDVYIRPEVGAFVQEKPLVLLPTATPTTTGASGYGSTPGYGPGPGSSYGATPGPNGPGGQQQSGVGRDIPLLGDYLGAQLNEYRRASPTTLIVDMLVVECRASAEPPQKPAASADASTAKTAE